MDIFRPVHLSDGKIKGFTLYWVLAKGFNLRYHNIYIYIYIYIVRFLVMIT